MQRSGEEAEDGKMQGNNEEDEALEKHTSRKGRGHAEQRPRRRRRGETVKQRRGGARGDAEMQRP